MTILSSFSDNFGLFLRIYLVPKMLNGITLKWWSLPCVTIWVKLFYLSVAFVEIKIFVCVFKVVRLFMLWLNAYVVACVKEFDGVLAGWPSAVLCDGSRPICYCRHGAVILPALALSLFINNLKSFRFQSLQSSSNQQDRVSWVIF